MDIVVTIAGVDKTDFIYWKSLLINNLLTRQVDTCKFETKSYEGKEYEPTTGDVVNITHDGTEVFGGVIVRTQLVTDGNVLKKYKIDCVDYTRLLDAKLVNEVYENQTVDDIIVNVVNNYTNGFTVTNVNCTNVIEKISFQYHTVSQCLQQLADLTQFHWYVDSSKDIHFFASGDEVASITITDDSGYYNRDSLIIRKDNRMIKNTIYVRGAEYLGDTLTADYISDGTQNVIPLTYRYDETDFSVTVTGSSKNVVQEPTEVPETADILWNNESRLIRFPTGKVSQNGSDIQVVGKPWLPVIAKVRDYGAIQTMSAAEGGTGEHEFYILDKSIKSKEAARQRGQAELYAYARSLTEGEFETYEDGLIAGQSIKITSSIFNVDESFIINKVTTKMWTPEIPVYKISLITKRTMGIIEFWQQMIARDKIILDVAENEITDTVESTEETISIVDTLTGGTPSVSHNPQADVMAVDEVTTPQAIDYATQFVYATLTPSGFRRQGLYNGAKYE